MEMESREFLELVGEAEGQLGWVNCLLDASISHDAAKERLLATIIKLRS